MIPHILSAELDQDHNEMWITGHTVMKSQTSDNNQPVPHRDVEVNAALLPVVTDESRLHPDVWHIDGAREQEEDGEARKQQADQHWRWYVQLPVEDTQHDLIMPSPQHQDTLLLI